MPPSSALPFASQPVLQISKSERERARFDQQRARAVDDIQGEARGRRGRAGIEARQRRSKYAARLRRGAAADGEIRAVVSGIGKAAQPSPSLPASTVIVPTAGTGWLDAPMFGLNRETFKP